MLAFIVILIVIGLIVGLIARLLVPGRDSIGLLGTIVLGIVGSFVGGFLQQLIEFRHLEVTHFAASGFIGSVIGAIVLLLILRVTGLEPGHGRSRSRSRGRSRASARRRWI
ncbi:MAG TPA: GlsB/YeaQ/YmgE family stress response membrane protein [Streptosporangiaceae bacterium]|nr:GlsB/YeaQ/YmgE family stress response membrane protein [Streptosporangiaceae bacterium]